MEKEYNKYLWNPKQPRVYGISPLTISGTPMSEEDVATSLKVENSQQRFQQNPIVKRSEQWEAQQKQREEEIAASKKWLELHPEDESDSPYTILERGKHQAIVDGKDPSYYEKMIDDGKKFTKGALGGLAIAASVPTIGVGATLAGLGLSHVGAKAGSALGSYIDNKTGASWVAPALGFVGSFAGFGAGAGGFNKTMLGLGSRGINVGKLYNFGKANAPSFGKQVGEYMLPKVTETSKPYSLYSTSRWKFNNIMKDLTTPTLLDDAAYHTQMYGKKATTVINNGWLIPTPTRPQIMGYDKIWWMKNQLYDPNADVIIQSPEALKMGTNNIVGGFSRHPDFLQTTGPISTKGTIVSKRADTGFTHTSLDPKTITLSKGRDFKVEPIPQSSTKGAYVLFERPSKLSEAEWLDVPKDLSPNISRSLGFSSTTGEELFMPNEILGEFVSGKNQAAKFFQQPVVQNSYAHNKELANRLGINIADRPENISEIVGAPIKLSPYIQNPGNELANIAQSYLGDPSATLSIAWTPFSKRVAKLTGIHEGLHRGHYAQVIKPAPPITKNYYETTMRPEATFWNWKINKLLKPEYQNGYLGGPFDGEAGVNLIEMGRDMGVKLGTKYPGDEVFMNMINNYNGHKSFLIPHLNLDTRAGRRHVWDAMTGQYFKQGGILKRK